MLDEQTAADQFRAKHLPRTVAHAYETVPLYRRLYAGIPDVNAVDLERLQELPVVTRAQLAAAGTEALSSAAPTDYIQHTSGTSGRCLFIHRSHAEAREIQGFLSRLQQYATPPPVRPVVLSLGNVYDGTPTEVPKVPFVLSGAVFDHNTLRNSRDLLLSRYDLPGTADRVSILSGSLHHLMIFTQYLRESGIETAALGLQSVISFGWHVSPYYHRFLVEAWNCQLIDRYSLTEVVGAGTNVDGTTFVFDAMAVPEIVDARGPGVPPGRVGRLVLTSLYPFVQRQPTIRYDTGDLFSETTDNRGVRRYRFRGRAAAALEDPDQPGSYLLTGADLSDVLHEIPQARRIPDRGSLNDLLIDRRVFGEVVLAGQVFSPPGGPHQVRLRVEADVPGGDGGTCAAGMAGRIARELRRLSPRLAAAEESGRVRFEVEVVQSFTAAASAESAPPGLDNWTWTRSTGPLDVRRAGKLHH